MRYPTTLVSTMLAATLATQAHAEPACEALRTLALPNAGVTAATVVPAGVFTPPPSPTPAPPLTLPAYCRVEGVAYEDPKWDFRTFDLARDFATALAKTGNILDSNDPNLGPFRDRGGKLLQYHGWGDAAISGFSSIDYYERVKQTLSGSGGKPVEDFYRLFMVPGMGHCAGGAGPNTFGNGTGDRGDPERDVRAAWCDGSSMGWRRND